MVDDGVHTSAGGKKKLGLLKRMEVDERESSSMEEAKSHL